MRLLAEVDLEADVVDDVVVGARAGLAAADGDDGDEVAEGGAVAAVVDEADLALLVRREHLAHAGDGARVCEEAGCAAADGGGGGGRLEEAAVAAEDEVVWVAGEAGEGGGGVDDGVVVAADVDEDEGAGEVDGAEGDAGVGTGGDAGEDGEEVEAGGGVEREAERGGGSDQAGWLNDVVMVVIPWVEWQDFSTATWDQSRLRIEELGDFNFNGMRE